MGRLLALSKHIWLMNGGDGPFNYFLQSYPSIKVRPPGSPPGRSRALLASTIHDVHVQPHDTQGAARTRVLTTKGNPGAARTRVPTSKGNPGAARTRVLTTEGTGLPGGVSG